MKWEVQVVGSEYDLKELIKVFASEEFRFFEKEGEYFFESTMLGMLTTADEVGLFASEILKVLSGATRLALQGRTQLRIVNIALIRDDGSRMVYVAVSEACYGRDSVYIKLPNKDDADNVRAPANQIPEWMRLSLVDPNVTKAFRIYAVKDDWGGLYQIYEVVESDIGGIDKIVSYDWATKTSLKRFKHTANSPGAVGDAARHGTEQTIPPPNPMHIQEARALIEMILHNWLRWKALGNC